MDAYDEVSYHVDAVMQHLMLARCRENPKDPRCADVPSYYMYEIDLVPNAVFLGVFGASLLGFVATYALTRRGRAFNAAMALGVACEVLGYAARVASWRNPWRGWPFLMQVCCLTVGPAFLAAGIYLCLRRVVRVFGPEYSRIPPAWYTRIFIPCDLASLILQAVGGALASAAALSGRPTRAGDAVTVAGLALQALTLLLFVLAAGDFALRWWRRDHRLARWDSGNMVAAYALDPDAAALRRLRASRRLRGFLAALALATVCVLWRCVFRVAELGGGWAGPLVARQDLFVGFEGAMVAVAVVALNVCHPGFCHRALLVDGAGDDPEGQHHPTKTGGVLEENDGPNCHSDGDLLCLKPRDMV